MSNAVRATVRPRLRPSQTVFRDLKTDSDGFPPVTVTAVMVFGGPLSLLPGATAQPDSVRVSYSDSTTKIVALSAVNWNSSAPTVATVNTFGMVAGVAPGNAQISALLSGVTGTLEVTVMKPAPTLDSVIVFNQSPITVPAAVQFQAVGYYSDKTSKEVSSMATWKSSDASVASVSSTGLVTALKAGTTQICALLGTFSNCTSVTILPDPILASWYGLSQTAKDYLLRMFVDIFGTARWNQATIKVFAQAGFATEDLQWAFTLWQQTLSGKINFVLVNDSASADVVVIWDESIVSSDICGGENPSRYGPDGAITGGIARYSTSAGCQGEPFNKLKLAHGLGHILGFAPHTAPSTDIMSSADMKGVMSPLLLEVAKWVYSVPVRTFPPAP